MTNTTPEQTADQAINVFTYGSLMYPDIFKQVAGHEPLSLTAFAHQWRRYGLANRTYPGAMPEEKSGCVIKGVLWLDVTAQGLAALDQFEGDEYRRVEIQVRTEKNALYRAYIYQWLLSDQVRGDWQLADFEQYHRKQFVQIHGNKPE